MPNTFLNRKSFPLNKGEKIPPLKFKLFGNWEKVIRTVQKSGPAVKTAGLYAQTKIAEEIKKKVKGHLVDQDLGWKQLSPKTSEIKQRAGVDGRILIAYGHYYHAIEVWKSGNQHLVYVGVRKGKHTYNAATGKRSVLDIAQIAVIHEFSSGKRVPKRPLWNPTLREMGGAEGIKKLYVKHLTNKLRSMGLPITQYRNIWR